VISPFSKKSEFMSDLGDGSSMFFDAGIGVYFVGIINSIVE